jgi:hypothetical protein
MKEGGLPKILRVAIECLAAKEDCNVNNTTAEQALQMLVNRRKEFMKTFSESGWLESREFLLQSRKYLTEALEKHPKSYYNNKSLVMRGLSIAASRRIYDFLSPALQKDSEVALKAIKTNPYIMQTPGFSDFRNKEFDLQALIVNHCYYKFISPKGDFWNGEESKFDLALIKKCLGANFLNFINLPEQLRKDPEFVLKLAEEFLPSLNRDKLPSSQKKFLNEVILEMVEVNAQILLHLPESPIKNKILNTCFNILKRTQKDQFASLSFEAFCNNPSLLEEKLTISVWESAIRRQAKPKFAEKLYSSIEKAIYFNTLLFYDSNNRLQIKTEDINRSYEYYKNSINSTAEIVFQYHSDKFIDDGWGAAERAFMKNPELLFESGDTITIAKHSIFEIMASYFTSLKENNFSFEDNFLDSLDHA